jgi:hypothetical protein
MAIFLAKRKDARDAYDKGAIEEGTIIPEFDKESEEE